MADISVRFWGVRGSLATPGRRTARYGGNTSCVEVRCGDELLVFDMGTGLRGLGESLSGRAARHVSFFLSHYHWDHILGLPFFAPAYDPRATLRIHGATREGLAVGEILSGQMVPPYFPVRMAEMPARLEFVPLADGARVQVGDAQVLARELSHPGGALGYRVERGDASVVYATDFEHGTAADEELVELARGADLLIYDATYTVPEYRRHKGWGHSTWAQGVRFARAAGVGRLVLFHHDPAHDDLIVEDIVRQARSRFPATDAAQEGKTYDLGGRSARRLVRRGRAAARRRG